MTRAVDLTPYGKLLRTFPQGLENGAPSPFPTDATATTTTGYSCCTQNRGEIGTRHECRAAQPSIPLEVGGRVAGQRDQGCRQRQRARQHDFRHQHGPRHRNRWQAEHAHQT